MPQFPREGKAGFLEQYCRLVGTELKPVSLRTGCPDDLAGGELMCGEPLFLLLFFL